MSIKTRNAKKYVKMIKTKNYWDGEMVKFAISIQHYQSTVNELTIIVNCNSHTLIHSLYSASAQHGFIWKPRYRQWRWTTKRECGLSDLAYSTEHIEVQLLVA